MKSSNYSEVTIDVNAQPGVEIFLVDGNMRRIASEVDRLQTTVHPGVYKLRYRLSNSRKEEFLVITGEENSIRHQAPTLHHNSSIPFYGEQLGSDVVREHAVEMSRTLEKKFGHANSELFLFVHDAGVALDGLTGVRVSTVAGEELIFLHESKSIHNGINLGLDDGTYRIALLNRQVGDYEFFVTTSKGWQTQVFIGCDDFRTGEISVRAPAINRAGIIMTRVGHGFDPSSRVSKLTDIALQALAQKRHSIAASVLMEMLHGKFEDPLLGVFGAHLMLLKSRPDERLLGTVQGNLERLIPNHPDVVLLGLRHDATARSGIGTIERPPMLRASWDLLVTATKRRASLVPPGSANSQIAKNAVVGRPWLIHRLTSKESGDSHSETTIAHAEDVANELLHANLADLFRLSGGAQDTTLDLNGLERTLINEFIREGQRSSEQVEMPHSSLRSEGDTVPFHSGSPARRLLSSVNAPKYSIAESVLSLQDKLLSFESRSELFTESLATQGGASQELLGDLGEDLKTDES